MADFDPPFAGNTVQKRLPTQSERDNGFPCGPASQALFNGMFHRIESEVGEVISFAGIPPTDDRYTQLREAIEALIAAATGGGDTSQFLLVSQARARLPIYPEIISADYRMNVTSPAAGTIRVPGGVSFMHRGVFPVVSVETDFVSVASKTYHVRWSVSGGYTMEDLADPAYNPTPFAENDPTFDSSYDDMLIARVVTNSSNIPTITNLANAALLEGAGDSAFLAPGNTFDQQTAPSQIAGAAGDTIDVNWARKPQAYLTGFTDVTVEASASAGGEMNVVVQALSRYAIKATYGRTQDAGGAWIGYAVRA